MRVVHVSTERGYGGGEVQVLLLMAGLRAQGVEQVLVTPRGSRASEIATRGGFEVAGIGLSHLLDFVSVVRLARRLRGATIVHLHTGRASWLGSLAAVLAGIPRVITRRTMRPVRRGPRSRFVYGSQRSTTIAISQAVSSVLQRGGVDPAKIAIVHDAVDEARVRERVGRAATRAALGLGDRTFAVLAAGKLSRGKGIDLLVRAVSALDDRNVLLLAGDGPERPSLRALAAELGLGDRVNFLGVREDMGDLLAACDALVMPSRHEGLGNSAMEAMGMRRPVIAARVGGLAELIVDGVSGLFFEAEDVGGLVSALARLRDDPALAAELAENGPGRLDQGFRIEQVVAEHLRIYRGIQARNGS